MLYYLRSLLSPHYTVYTDFDAAAGYKTIGEEHPDLVLCDVLMHGMDGYRLCRKVKDNISMCHIPFVLLTARASVDDQIKGFDSGANAYIVKPFDPDYLLVMIRSQLDNSNRMRNMLTHATRIPEIGEDELNHQDRKFVAALYELMDREKSNPDLNITRISEELHMSRTKLFYKMKALTGETPHAFFNHYKLNRAAEMLLEGRYKISAFAELVGFQSASHFTTVFKKEFGCLPSEYPQMIRKEE